MPPHLAVGWFLNTTYSYGYESVSLRGAIDLIGISLKVGSTPLFPLGFSTEMSGSAFVVCFQLDSVGVLYIKDANPLSLCRL